MSFKKRNKGLDPDIGIAPWKKKSTKNANIFVKKCLHPLIPPMNPGSCINLQIVCNYYTLKGI